MAWHFSWYLLPTFLAALASVVVAAVAWRHRSERTARPFTVLMLALAWWAFAYGVQLGFTERASMLRWDQLAFVGSVVVPAAFLLTAVEYAGFEDRLPRGARLLLAVEPAATLALVWTFPATRLVWQSVGVDRSGPLSILALEFGPWYWVNYAYSFLLIGAGLALFGYVAVRGTRLYRRQSVLLIAGAVVPLGANLAFNLAPSLNPASSIDHTTFALSATGVLYALALFRFRMLDLAPVARELVLEEVGDGFVVVDPAGAIVEANDVGRAVVADERARFERAASAPDELDGWMVQADPGDGEHTYEAKTLPVADFRGERIGTLVALRDVTELDVIRKQEQRLSVLNRLLRHNIRNEMSVVAGNAELLADRLDGDDRAAADTITTHARRMAALGTKARHVESVLSNAGPRTVADAAAIVADRAPVWRRRYPEATVEIDVPERAPAAVSDAGQLETALDELVENAVVHHDGAAPRVTVTVALDDESVAVRVIDDGPGVPAAERAVLSTGRETAIEHGSGLGLWLVSWIVDQSGGRLDIADGEDGGSAVAIDLDRAE
ncbi:MAG: histidine kinase N-terminal 7TM domain-containing protein [Haloarculaceae archaeon]